jgi:hypothetical protein
MRSVIWTLAFLAAACGSKDHSASVDPSTTTGAGGTEGTGGGGGSDEDASSDDAQGDGAIPCGAKSCNAGEYCCDGACGACVAIGMNCPSDPCGTGDGAAPE